MDVMPEDFGPEAHRIEAQVKFVSYPIGRTELPPFSLCTCA